MPMIGMFQWFLRGMFSPIGVGFRRVRRLFSVPSTPQLLHVIPWCIANSAVLSTKGCIESCAVSCVSNNFTSKLIVTLFSLAITLKASDSSSSVEIVIESFSSSIHRKTKRLFPRRLGNNLVVTFVRMENVIWVISDFVRLISSTYVNLSAAILQRSSR